MLSVLLIFFWNCCLHDPTSDVEIFTLLISKTRNIKNEILLIITMPSLTKISGTSLTLLALLISKFIFTNTREKIVEIKCFDDFTFLYRTKKMIAFMTFFLISFFCWNVFTNQSVPWGVCFKEKGSYGGKGLDIM